MLACLAVWGFAACEPEQLVDNTPVTGHPEQDAAGVYVGTWTRILDADTTYAEGTITLTADTAYVVNIAVDTAGYYVTEKIKDLDEEGNMVEKEVLKKIVVLEPMSSLANIAQESYHGTVFTNLAGTASGFGVSFRGRTYTNADGQPEMMLAFVKSVKVGRKNYQYNFKFVGIKQAGE